MPAASLEDMIFDQIALAHSTVEVPKVTIGESEVTFDIKLNVKIDRKTFDLLESICHRNK
jgi:hypothetical protein